MNNSTIISEKWFYSEVDIQTKKNFLGYSIGNLVLIIKYSYFEGCNSDNIPKAPKYF